MKCTIRYILMTGLALGLIMPAMAQNKKQKRKQERKREAFIYVDTTAIYNGLDQYPTIETNAFKAGEELTFKISYGIFSIGKGVVKVQPEISQVNGRPCYKIDVKGKTTGLLDWVAKVDDHWGGYVDTLTLLPHISYRNLSEGNYRRKELVKFDYNTGMLEIKTINFKTGKFKEPDYIQFPYATRELISGFSYLRAIPFDTLKTDDLININAFYEDTVYHLQARYLGKDEIKIEGQKIHAVKFAPILPENSIFKGEDAVTAWFSDDENRVPLRIEARMFIGHGSVELTDYKGLKGPLNWVRKNN